MKKPRTPLKPGHKTVDPPVIAGGSRWKDMAYTADVAWRDGDAIEIRFCHPSGGFSTIFMNASMGVELIGQLASQLSRRERILRRDPNWDRPV